MNVHVVYVWSLDVFILFVLQATWPLSSDLPSTAKPNQSVLMSCTTHEATVQRFCFAYVLIQLQLVCVQSRLTIEPLASDARAGPSTSSHVTSAAVLVICYSHAIVTTLTHSELQRKCHQRCAWHLSEVLMASYNLLDDKKWHAQGLQMTHLTFMVLLDLHHLLDRCLTLLCVSTRLEMRWCCLAS